ncbi:hypothetical protein [Pelagicoccus sp. SDUM812002]|uniref:hypothetical protein n=1 Tax=Pelagicoccus sp. SDUM812002 TaxID=3041266 RepID=UPI00280EEE53|nr:hypothetical protein [Pelagicoccus sp. SDUM812002]MDQ8188529.1 hypothetical protein [Pelagicoccus sp. SDUM812002]
MEPQPKPPSCGFDDMQTEENGSKTPNDPKWNLFGTLFALLSICAPFYYSKYDPTGGYDFMGYGRLFYVVITIAILSPTGIAFGMASLAREERWKALTVLGFIINGFFCFVLAAILTILLWNY